MNTKILLILIAAVLVTACAKVPENYEESVVAQEPGLAEDKLVSEMRLSSPAFENNADIPSKYTCDGENINPQLNIEDVPAEAKSIVLIADDPDASAGTWVHWVVVNIPASENIIIEENSVPGKQLTNDFGKTSYGGPCPPSETHRYSFKVYALDTELDLDESKEKADAESAMKGHVIAQAQLVGLYSRG